MGELIGLIIAIVWFLNLIQPGEDQYCGTRCYYKSHSSISPGAGYVHRYPCRKARRKHA